MTRKRMIDPSIWQDEEFGSLSCEAQILFIGLFSNADDEGRLKANASYLKSTIFMYKDWNTEVVRKFRDEVIKKMNTVLFYVVNEKEYIQLKSWDEYQKQHKDRVVSSTIPPYSEQVTDNVGQVTDNVGTKISKDKISKDNIHDEKRRVSFSGKNSEEIRQPYKRKPLEQQTPQLRVCYAYEDLLGTKIVNWGKQMKAVSDMFKAGYTEKQIIYTIKKMKNTEFYQDKFFDLMTVANEIPRVKAVMQKGVSTNGADE